MHLHLARLADPSARATAARWLLAGCALGFAITLVGLALTHQAGARWLFALVVWSTLVYLPLRLLMEAVGSLAPGLRRAVAARVAADPDRYRRPAWRELMVGDLYAREVVLPRIAHPVQARQIREAAVEIIGRAMGRPEPRAAVRDVIRGLVAAIGHAGPALSARATGAAAAPIQARWEDARALGALAGLARLLAAAHTDQWDVPPEIPELGGRALSVYLEAAVDYCDEAALEVEAVPWTEPSLSSSEDAADAGTVWARWTAFVAAGSPAPRALAALLEVLQIGAGD